MGFKFAYQVAMVVVVENNDIKVPKEGRGPPLFGESPRGGSLAKDGEVRRGVFLPYWPKCHNRATAKLHITKS